MNTDLEKLGLRAVACKRWRWMPGMLLCRPPWEGEKKPYRYRIPDGFCVAEGLKDAYPDLSDPATLGCLLALVREAHNAPHAWVEVRYGQRARVLSPDNFSEGIRMLSEWQIGTEAAALVAALEAAP